MEVLKLIFGLLDAAVHAKGEQRAEIIARLVVELENMEKADKAEDAAHIERTTETQRAIDEAKAAPNPTVLVNPAQIFKSDEHE